MTSSEAPRSPTTPLFQAQHFERYGRQELIRSYEAETGARLIVVIDQIFPANMTFVEELLVGASTDQELHVLIASPGGDGETAVRMVRAMQSRCSRLTMLVPDMAKSAATLMCLGADEIVMGPGGDLGPVDPQFQIGGRSLASAKEIVAAIDEAEARVVANPDSFPLFATLLSDVNMLMVEQARSALARTTSLVMEALGCATDRDVPTVAALTEALRPALIDEPTSHSAVVSADAARTLGLPIRDAVPSDAAWTTIWSLWTRYFSLGCFPVGPCAIYEGARASQVINPPG